MTELEQARAHLEKLCASFESNPPNTAVSGTLHSAIADAYLRCRALERAAAAAAETAAK